MRYPNIVYDIPTAYYFKWQLGRTGVSGVFKSSNSYIEKITTALGALEPHRGSSSMLAINFMRKVRKICYEILLVTHNNGLSQMELAKVRELAGILTNNIDEIMVSKLGEQNKKDINRFDQRTLAYQDDRSRLPVDTSAIRPQPKQGLILGKDYHLERATSQHYDDGLIENWLCSDSKLGISDWVNTVYAWRERDKQTPNFKVPTGVRYLSALERLNFQVNFRGGKAYNSSNALIHTSNFFSSHSKNGWGIYVLGLDRKLYIGEHSINKFHHSSFFSGGPVLAGGEIAIDSGRVVGITNKTGHYRAGPRELRALLEHFVLCLVDISDLAVQDPFLAPNKWFKGQEALAAKGMLETLGDSTTVKPQVL